MTHWKRSSAGLARVLGTAALLLSFGAPARAVTINFSSDAAGLIANGFTSADSALVHFSDSIGSDLQILDGGVQTHGNAIVVFNDDPSFLIMTLDVPASSISLAFGNDDPVAANPGDEAVLRVSRLGSPVAEIRVAMNLNDAMDQTISYSGALFDRAEFFYDVSTSGLIEAADDIQIDFDTCGNGAIGAPIEECDDGDISPGDGCDASCQIEAGYLCNGEPSVCVAAIPVTAVKLIAVDKGVSGAKAVFVAKDLAITKGTGTDVATIGVTLDVTYDNAADPTTAGQFVAAAGSSNWLVNKSTVAKYVNKTAPTGGATKVSVIKPGKLVKLVGKNLGDTPLDILSQSTAVTGAANTAFCITNGSDSACFCSTFATCAWKSIAGGSGAKLVCKTGTGDSSCTALP